MNKNLLFFFSALIFALNSCDSEPEKRPEPKVQFLTYCGSCHQAPDPANLPKDVWENNVLPEMAARMGYIYKAYNPLAKNSMKENMYVELSGMYPKQAMIDSLTWQEIHDYILSLAPENIPTDTLRSLRNLPLAQFKPKLISLDSAKPLGVTMIQFSEENSRFLIGDARGQLFTWPEPSSLPRFQSPVMSYLRKGETVFATDMGYMNPSENPRGALYRINAGKTDTLVQKLHRPVYTEINDLDNDGNDEILICEFGNLTGELSLFTESAGAFEKRSLSGLPGTIKTEITDMNGDGIKDIVVLASQGNEGIYILYGKENLEFRTEQLIKLGPEYGSSWFQLIDYNNDNQLDILLANGDNMDYSIFPKPYHGLRLFLNEGKKGFRQTWFYPIYGATRVLAEDYDADGDLDFAVLSYFPEYGHSSEESFVYLENKNAEEYLFQAYTFPESLSGRWMVMEDGDFDKDGDKDILLGSFLMPIDRKYTNIISLWQNKKADVLLLENKN